MNNSIFASPYDHWRADEILAYYQQRTSVRYFALRDAEQASPQKIAGVLGNQFEFNDETYCLPSDFDWTHNPSADKEWLILLHKFYFAVGLGEEFCSTGDRRYLDTWVALTQHWIDSVALDFLPSDVTGRRLQNWIFAHYFFVSQAAISPESVVQAGKSWLSPAIHQQYLTSLHIQVDYLCSHLTPARNHRTIELYAIFMAAVVFPELKDAAEWLHFARQELVRNIQTDLLEDGVHCEMSTDYHHLVLRNYLGILTLAHLNQIAMPAAFEERLQAGLEFAKAVHKPDGTIPSLSDGDARSFVDVLLQGYQHFGDEELRYVATAGTQGRAPQPRARLFANSGYAILRSGWGDQGEAYTDERYLVFDCGPLGAGNHGHLDMLSIEMAAYGQSLIVDPGRHTYHEAPPDSGETNWRRLFRGTSYHNTVTVDNKEQTRYEFRKNRFRIAGPEPTYELRTFLSNDRFDYLHGLIHSHEYPVTHERRLFFVRPFYWVITDILHAAETHRYDLRFHLSHHAFGQTVCTANQSTQTVDAPHLLLAQPQDPEIAITVEDGFVSSTYGVKQPAPVVCYTCQRTTAIFHTVLFPYKTKRPVIEVTPIAVLADQHQCVSNQALAVRIDVQHNNQHWVDTCFSSDGVTQGSYHFAGFISDGTPIAIRTDIGKLKNG